MSEMTPERLRQIAEVEQNQAVGTLGTVASRALDAAADEIERLCHDIERHVGITTSQQAEIELLRAALTELAILGEQGMKPDYKEWLTFHDKVVQVAHAALEMRGG